MLVEEPGIARDKNNMLKHILFTFLLFVWMKPVLLIFFKKSQTPPCN